jgi:hypothetical protein
MLFYNNANKYTFISLNLSVFVIDHRPIKWAIQPIRMCPRKLFITFFFLLPGFILLEANEWITISGFVRDSNGRGIELAYVKDSLTKQTVTTDEDGYYSMTLPARDTVLLFYHCLSYQPAIRLIPVELSNMMVNVTLSISSRTLNEVIIKGQQRQTDSFDKLSLSNIRLQPDPSGGSIESMLATLPASAHTKSSALNIPSEAAATMKTWST